MEDLETDLLSLVLVGVPSKSAIFDRFVVSADGLLDLLKI